MGLVPRVKLLLTIGATFFLDFWPWILSTIAFFYALYLVNMDGIPIGKKVDLNAHSSYESLAQALEDMFLRSPSSVSVDKEQVTKPFKLLEGSFVFVPTYEDKEGDWMLVGDVPWRYAAIFC